MNDQRSNPESIQESIRASTPGVEEPDLTGWLAGHDIMRTQFALLARAAGEVGEQDTKRLAALEDHLGFMTLRLAWHHQHEDDDIWPAMRRLDLSLVDLLDDLESDHHHLDELLAVTSDTGTPLTKRSTALGELHRELTAHLDREETDAVPAIRRLIPASAWAIGDQRFQDELGADRTTTLVWILGHLPPPARAAMLAELPGPVRLLYRAVLRPRHQRQMKLMYG
jgi:hypothetical protein